MQSMKILFVAAEMAPLSKVGGLGEVVGTLPGALAARGHDVRVLVPAYERSQARECRTLMTVSAGKGRLVECSQPDLPCPVWLLETPGFLKRRGRPYLNKSGQPWADNAIQFGLLSSVAADIAQGSLDIGWHPDVVHCNDWHTGLTPVWMRLNGAAAASVFTIHNAGFTGCFPPGILEKLGLPASLNQPEALEFYGSISFLKGGLNYSDQLTTVSPRYGAEIQTTEFGGGMEGVFQARSGALTGILNGIDYDRWNPATDPMLDHHFDENQLHGKALQRQELIRDFRLAFDHSGKAPVIGWVGRLTDQKGIDLLIRVLPELMKRDLRVVLLGDGEPAYKRELRELGKAYEGKLSVHLGYDEILAHNLYAGADMLLMPSRFEPCGLAQMIAMRYGTIPLVTPVGGLADTVKDPATAELNATGLQLKDGSAESVLETISRAIELYGDDAAWRTLMVNAMQVRFEWDLAAEAYEGVYHKALQQRMLGHYPRVA